MGKASEWLREERRKVLGDWVAFCLECGAAQRWFEEFEAEVPEDCPQCGGRGSWFFPTKPSSVGWALFA